MSTVAPPTDGRVASEGGGSSRYVVVALFAPLEVGASISRARWPAHVTVVTNFVTASPVEVVEGVIRETVALDAPFVVHLEGRDLFGPNRDVPVLLVRPGRLDELHGRLVDVLEPLGAVAEEPAYWREGFRPHLTLGPAVEAEQGRRRVVSHFAVVRLEEETAMVLSLIGLRADAPANRSTEGGMR